MKALVTGGGGFLGSALVRALLDDGHEVTAVGRNDYPAVAALGAKTARVDVTDRDGVLGAVGGHDTVFHVAAKAGVWGNRGEYQRINVAGTNNVIEACREHGVRKLIYTSSPSVVFGGHDHRNADASLPYPPHYECDYPETKAAAERAVLAANSETLATASLRPHLIYGPQDPHLLPRVFDRARKGRMRIVGDGDNEVSVTYVDNAAAGHLQAARRLEPGVDWAGRAFFINDPEPVALWAWLNGLLDRLGLPRVTRRVPLSLARGAGTVAEGIWRALSLSGEPPMTRFVASQLATSHTYSIEPAREAFGYAPPVSAIDALDRTVAWWRERLRT